MRCLLSGFHDIVPKRGINETLNDKMMRYSHFFFFFCDILMKKHYICF